MKTREELDADSEAVFTSLYNGFMEELSEIRRQDAKFIDKLTEDMEKLSTAFTSEEVEIATTKGSKRTKTIISIADCAAQFKNLIETEDAKLKDLWEQWEAVRVEYDQLVEEVFGPDDGLPTAALGFKSEMEQLDLQHEESVKEVTLEVTRIREQSIKKMKASKKVSAYHLISACTNHW